jgi:hypothetical protein
MCVFVVNSIEIDQCYRAALRTARGGGLGGACSTERSCIENDENGENVHPGVFADLQVLKDFTVSRLQTSPRGSSNTGGLGGEQGKFPGGSARESTLL